THPPPPLHDALRIFRSVSPDKPRVDQPRFIAVRGDELGQRSTGMLDRPSGAVFDPDRLERPVVPPPGSVFGVPHLVHLLYLLLILPWDLTGAQLRGHA